MGVGTHVQPLGLTAGDIAPCREQAVPGLVKIGSQFANELLDGLTPKTEQYVCTAARDRFGG